MRGNRILAGTAILGATALGGSLFSGSALATTARSVPAAGPVQIYAPQSGDGIHGTIVITGAIGDYGKTLSVDQDGKTDAKGNYVKITLQKGTFEINSTAADAVFNKLQPAVDKTTCSAAASASAPVTLLDGTGLYQGITGTVTTTATFGFIGPLYASGKNKGQCNLSNSAQPISQYTLITGKGNVSF